MEKMYVKQSSKMDRKSCKNLW